MPDLSRIHLYGGKLQNKTDLIHEVERENQVALHHLGREQGINPGPTEPCS